MDVGHVCTVSHSSSKHAVWKRKKKKSVARG
jgi:hypothetical protein